MMVRIVVTISLYACAWLTFVVVAYAARFAPDLVPYAALGVVLLLILSKIAADGGRQ